MFDTISEILEKIKATTKQTGIDVRKVRLQIIQIVKKAIKVAQKIQNNTDTMSMTLTNLFENMKTATIQHYLLLLPPLWLIIFVLDYL